MSVETLFAEIGFNVNECNDGTGRVYLTPRKVKAYDTAEVTRLKTIERAALALLVNRKDLGLIGQREALMSDLATAFGPIDPKQHKVKFP